MHQALQPRAGDDRQIALMALLAEQRRTNRILVGMLWAAIGFVLGVIIMTAFLRPML